MKFKETIKSIKNKHRKLFGILSIVFGLILGMFFSRAASLYWQLRNVNVILQFSIDLKNEYYNSETIKKIFSVTLGEDYTGDYYTDFNNYVISKVVDDLNAQETDIAIKNGNFFVGHSKQKLLSEMKDKLSDNSSINFDENFCIISAFNFNKKLLNITKDNISEINNCDYLFIDIRDNTGGSIVDMALYANLFLKDGDIITRCITNSEKTSKIFKATQNQEIIVPQIVFITNNYTASSAEQFILALKENIGVTIIGKKSYGKGFGQFSRSINYDTSYILPTFKWYSPNNNSINGQGIEPDIHLDNIEVTTAKVVEEYFKTIEK